MAAGRGGQAFDFGWWLGRDLNSRPHDYESAENPSFIRLRSEVSPSVHGEEIQRVMTPFRNTPAPQTETPMTYKEKQTDTHAQTEPPPKGLGLRLVSLRDRPRGGDWRRSMHINMPVYYRRQWRAAGFLGRASGLLEDENLTPEMVQECRRLAPALLWGGGPYYDSDQKIYALLSRSANLIKIGRSRKLHERLASFKTTDPTGDLCLLAAATCPDGYEATVHKLLREHRVRGEWFKPSWQTLWVVSEIYECAI